MKEMIAVVGGGSFGTALASLAASNGHDVILYVRENEIVESVNKINENSMFMAGVKLPKNITAKNFDELKSTTAKYFIWAVPSQFTRNTAKNFAETLKGKNIMLVTKGLEIASGKLILTVIEEELSAHYAVLSGPSFAKEIALEEPTAVSIAAKTIEEANWWQKTLSNDYFRAYTSTDMIGLEIGGSIKNVIAIASGISDGMGFENNTRAALITRGLAEITRFGIAYGAKPDTFMGLSGVGDLVLTATGLSSRNFQVGQLLAQSKTIEEISASMNMVAEGVPTAKAVYLQAKERGIDMPICSEVYKIIYEKKPAKEAMKDLMMRPLRQE